MAIVFDSATTYNTATDEVTSLTFSHTVGSAGTKRILLVGTCNNFYDGSRVDSITHGGNTLTKLRANNASGGPVPVRIELWYLVGPPTGTNDVAVSFKDSDGATTDALACVTACGFTGVDAGDPFGAYVEADSATTDIGVIVTSGAGQMIIDVAGQQTTNWLAQHASQTLIGRTRTTRADITADVSMGMSYEAGAASVSMDWTSSDARSGAIIGVPLLPAADARARAVKYFFDIYDPEGRILDASGRVVPPWEIEADNWIKVTGVFPPTSKVYDTFTQDPELAYIESVKWTMGGGLDIKTNRGDIPAVLLARAAGRKTL